MKKIEIEVGINYQKISRGHEPITYAFNANVVEYVVGGYGISGFGECKSRLIEVMVPEWVEEVQVVKPNVTHIGRPGFEHQGTRELCFVVCKKPVEQRECEYFGEGNSEEIIDEAIQGGFELIYPNEKGKMEKMDIEMA